MEIKSAYFNYYNVKGRYSPETPQTPAWQKLYSVVDDRIESNNHNPDSEIYQAHCKLDEIYYNAAESNRAKYKDEHSLKQALGEKYLFGETYKDYSYSQRRAMYENELNMTMFGTCGNMNDPRLSKEVVAPTDAEQATYNRQMVNTQLNNILSNAGINSSQLGDLTFSIDSFNQTLSIIGLEGDNKNLIEQLLNSNNNATELFYHLIQSNRSQIDDSVLNKYRVVHDFKEIVGEDLRTYQQTEDGLVDANGRNALDVYKEALQTTDRVPARFKGAAFDTFAKNINNLMDKDFTAIPDLNIQIGFSHGKLHESLSNASIIKGLNVFA